MSKIALIVPCFNEAKRLKPDKFHAFLEKNPGVDICFVNDGSEDDTSAVIEKTASEWPAQIYTLHLERNSGKAEAVRRGILKMASDGEYEWLGFWDADLSAPLEEIHNLLSYETEAVKLLMCSRVIRLGANVKRHPIRHILSRIMAFMVSHVLKMPVYDAQCGAKLIRSDEIETAFAEKFLAKWLFDVELIARIKKKYSEKLIHSYIVEVPVFSWEAVPDSKFKFKHMLLSLVELFNINRKYRLKHPKPR